MPRSPATPSSSPAPRPNSARSRTARSRWSTRPFPGMLPVPNEECLRQAVRTGMALNAQINAWSRFDRKNYFYADLPQGYQISQLYHPIVGEGAIEVDLRGRRHQDDRRRAHPSRAGCRQADARSASGFLLCRPQPPGVALMEIVSRPDMRSPEEAGAYVRKLRAILRYVGSCDGNMEQGSMRADVNVSVRRPGESSAPVRRPRTSIRSASSWQ